mmetsp:Transcript_49022/g.79757  ORF Transcript_49022/g.79757 Transcript_49022/m.79757 type:complete len:83 (-) Transcript_49022:742-990(-)
MSTTLGRKKKVQTTLIVGIAYEHSTLLWCCSMQDTVWGFLCEAICEMFFTFPLEVCADHEAPLPGYASATLRESGGCCEMGL